MSDYLRVPIPVEPSDINDLQIADLRTRIPDWAPNPLRLDTATLEVIALRLAVTNEVASGVLDTVFRENGATLYGVPPLDATFATVQSTWTMRDDAGYQIPAGTEVKVNISGDQAIGFAVTDLVEVAPGDTVTAAGEVTLQALVAGASGSGLSGTADPVTLLDGVDSIALVGVSTGGRDAEQDRDFLDRLTRRLRRLTFGVVLPADVEEAVTEIAGVDRCLVIDNYVPAGPADVPPADDAAAAALTVVPIDAAGQDVSTDVADAIVADLEASREQGFLFSVMNATRTDVTVAFTATAYPGFDTATVQADGIAAVSAYGSPANWGQPRIGDQRRWLEDLKVRFGEVYAVLNEVQGIDHVLTVTINGSLNTDATLTGPGALPNFTSVTGTVT